LIKRHRTENTSQQDFCLVCSNDLEKKNQALLSYQLTDPTESTFKGDILPFGRNFNFSIHVR